MRVEKAAAKAAVIVFGLAAVAGSAPTADAVTSPAPNQNAPLATKVIKTGNFAGYAVAPGPFMGQAHFKVPKVTCTSANSGVLSGVFLVGPGGLNSQAGIAADCTGGKASYFVYFIINNVRTNSLTVKPGDSVTVTASEIVDGANLGTALRVHDGTSGAAPFLTGPGGGVTGVLVGCGQETVGGTRVGVAKFTSILFKNVVFGRVALGAAGPVAAEMVIGTTVQMVPTAIVLGDEFNVVFMHT